MVSIYRLSGHIDVADYLMNPSGDGKEPSAAATGRQPTPGSPASLALHFDLPGLHLCVPLQHVCKVLALMALQEVPSSPAYFVGLLNFGGDAVPVIDLGRYLQRPPFAWHADTPVVLCEANGQRCGFVVENVLGVRLVGGRQRRVGDVVRDSHAPFVTVFDSGEDLVFVLDAQTVVANLLPV